MYSFYLFIVCLFVVGGFFVFLTRPLCNITLLIIGFWMSNSGGLGLKILVARRLREPTSIYNAMV